MVLKRKMFLKALLKHIIFTVLLLDRLIACQSLPLTDEDAQVDIHLKHFLKRIELVAYETVTQFSAELQELMDKIKHALATESEEEKSLLLENYNTSMEFEKFLNTEIDKQYIDEDILMELWYLNEISPYVSKDLHEEIIYLMHELKEAYRVEDLEKKFNMYNDVGENMSEDLLVYVYGEDQTVPLLNAQLKYYVEYLQYLLKQNQLDDDFQKYIHQLLAQVITATASLSKTEKENVIDNFDDLTTKYGRYLDEHLWDFKMFKFGAKRKYK